MASLCDNIILLVEFILRRFMADIHIVGRVNSSRLNNEKLQAQRESLNVDLPSF